MELVVKKYALNNSYFKNKRPNDPSTPFEVLEYRKIHNELPYNSEITDNWFYECFVEYQKRAGVYCSQFFTPPEIARRVAEVAFDYLKYDKNNITVLDACCGFGMITKELINVGFKHIIAFDCDTQLTDACKFFCGKNARVLTEDFKKEKVKNIIVKHTKYDAVVSNPPYEVKELTDFLFFLEQALNIGGLAILLIPIGFVDKERPKRLVTALNQFRVIERILMAEDFARTKAKAEIVVLRKLK